MFIVNKKIWPIVENGAWMDRIHGQHRALMRSRLRTYLREQLTKPNDPMWVGEWDTSRSTYWRVMKRTMGRTCSVYIGLASVDIPYAAQQIPNEAQWRNTIESRLEIANDVQARLVQYSADPKIRCMILRVRISYGAQRPGHAAFLIFDTKRRLQIYFDSDDFLMVNANTSNPFSITRAFCTFQQPLIPGYTIPSPEQCAWNVQTECLQHVMETGMQGVGLTGQCGILAQLVLLCCTRFRYFNPKDMADLIIEALPTQAERRDFIHVLLMWYYKISQPGLTDNEFDSLAHPETTHCPCFSPNMKRICRRTSCSEGSRIYCWQHRHLISNPHQTVNKRCGAPHVVCPYNN